MNRVTNENFAMRCERYTHALSGESVFSEVNSVGRLAAYKVRSMPENSNGSFNKLTENAGEAFLDELFGADAVYEIPYFQRRYKWKKAKVESFQDDVLRLVDEEDTEGHFLGAVILQGARSITRPNLARKYQVIDGQQRLTTIFLHLLAAVDVLVETDDDQSVALAADYFRKYIVVTSSTQGNSNFKLHSCGEDRRAMNQVVSGVFNKPKLRVKLAPLELVQLSTGDGPPSMQVSKNYDLAKRWMRQQSQHGGMNRVDLILTALLLGMTVVQIVVQNPLNGPTIFDSLNSKQEQMTVGELVRNDIFARLAGQEDRAIQSLYTELWNPFYEKFGEPDDRWFDGYFFPYGLLALSANVKKADVYPKLRETWSERNLYPGNIVTELGRFQDDYLDLLSEGNRCQHPMELANSVRNLRSFGLPTSIFSFLIKVSHEARTGNLSMGVAVRLFAATESFLVRRGAFGLEPSGLHAAFKGMWEDILRRRSDDPEGSELKFPDYLKASIGSRSTVKWPNDDEFRTSLKSRKLYGSLVTPYILQEFDRSLGNDGVSYEDAEIEHVLPQRPSEEWNGYFNDEQREELQHVIGNLTLLSEPMNSELSNGPYRLKRETFSAESRFRITRELAAAYETWTPTAIEQRGKSIADWAVTRWPE